MPFTVLIACFFTNVLNKTIINIYLFKFLIRGNRGGESVRLRADIKIRVLRNSNFERFLKYRQKFHVNMNFKLILYFKKHIF